MPQRFLRPGIRTSERWNSVSRDAQALYVAILTLVDDFGRYDGRPAVLHGDAFSVWNELNPECAVNPQRVAALCGELQTAKLVHFYEVQGKRCLQMIQWEERIREGAKEKWPKPNESDFPDESAGKRSGTQESAGKRIVALPPSSPPPSSPASPPSPGNGAAVAGNGAGTKPEHPTTFTLDDVAFFQNKVGGIFGRVEASHWSQSEQYSMNLILKRPDWKDELDEITCYRNGIRPDRLRFEFPASLPKLLDDWGGTLDKARVVEMELLGDKAKKPESGKFLKHWDVNNGPTKEQFTRKGVLDASSYEGHRTAWEEWVKTQPSGGSK